jgi:hypothetical protein
MDYAQHLFKKFGKTTELCYRKLPEDGLGKRIFMSCMTNCQDDNSIVFKRRRAVVLMVGPVIRGCKRRRVLAAVK